MGELSPPRPCIAIRILNRVHRLLPIQSKLSLHAILFVKKLGSEVTPRSARGLSFELAGPEELEFIGNHPEALSKKVYSSRIRNGDRCYCLLRDGEVVCYNWVRFSSCCVFCGRRTSFNFIPLSPGQVFIYDLYTYEEHRGQELAGHMKDYLMYELQSEGLSETLSIVEPANMASVKIHIRTGSKVRSLVHGFGLFGWTKTISGTKRDEASMRQWVEKVADSLNAG